MKGGQVMKKEYIFFDFDGTLVDTSEGIYAALEVAYEKMNLPPISATDKRKYIGPPLEASFMAYANMNESEADEATVYFRAFYKEKGVKMHRVYDGVIDTLKELKQRGKKLIIATSKPQPLAESILKWNDFYQLFDVISGATFDGTRSTKEQVLNHALSFLGDIDLSSCVLVGDSKSDALGAKKVKMDCIGALYGFGTKNELEENGVICTIEKPQDLLNIID